MYMYVPSESTSCEITNISEVVVGQLKEYGNSVDADLVIVDVASVSLQPLHEVLSGTSWSGRPPG